MKIGFAVMACTLGASLAPAAWGHASLERSQAPSGSYYKAVLSVSHGCSGSPTVNVRVRIPDGVTSAKPQPKPGWTLSIKRTKLPKSVDAGHGRMIDEVVSEVAWTGGMLADNEFDEFKIVMKLPDKAGTTLYLPVVQECKEGVHRWIEVPQGGKPASELKEPAPALLLTPKP